MVRAYSIYGGTMYHTVEDETGLPRLDNRAVTYIRLLSDPTLMQHGMTGDIYVRQDGQPWDADGYRVHSDGTAERRNRLA